MKINFKNIILISLSIMLLIILIMPNFSKADYRTAMNGLISNQDTQWQDNSTASEKVRWGNGYSNCNCESSWNVYSCNIITSCSN